MKNSKSIVVLLAGGLGLALVSAHAAAPDWGKVTGRTVTVFYPGVSPQEWVTKGGEHGGARALRKGETCASCHDSEAADMGKKMASGQKLEPKPIKGKAGSIPVNVQAANDGSNLYLRFSWKQPAGGAEKMDKDNAVKLAFMLEDNKVPGANLSGCWEACHGDARTMPDAAAIHPADARPRRRSRRDIERAPLTDPSWYFMTDRLPGTQCPNCFVRPRNVVQVCQTFYITPQPRPDASVQFEP